ncbi:MAG TPA: beta-galactosidase [Armatimonadota bacterium]|jgi:hypothetical protein
MKTYLTWRHLLVVLTLALLSSASMGQGVTPFRNLPVLPASEWQVTCERGNTVSLSERDGCLAIAFDVNVHDYHQVGNQVYKQASFRVLRTSPMPLSPDAGRVIYDALGHQPAMLLEQVRLLPVLRDAQGELLIYTANAYPQLNRRDGCWGRWMSPYFYCGEAGGATQDVFEVEGRGNAWPEGPLTFVGFQVEVRRTEFGRKQGKLYLGGVQFCGMKLPYEEPFLYADSALTSKGDYRLAAEISNSFQWNPIREISQTVSYDPDNLQSHRQRVAFPLGRDDNYWMRYQITAADGKVVAGNELRAQVTGSPEMAASKPVAVTQPPVMGYLRVNPVAHTNGVYAIGEPLKVALRLFPKAAKTLTLRWQVTAYGYPAVLEHGEQEVTFGREVFRDVPLTVAAQPGRDAYRLLLSVVRDGKAVDQRAYYLGHQTDFRTPYTGRLGKVLDRDYVKQASYNRVSYFNPTARTAASEDVAFKHFSTTLDEISRITRYVTYMIDLRDLEVLPGVYDFALLDRVMDAAADRGCALTIRVGHVDQEGEFHWQRYSRQLSYDGTEIPQPFYGGFAVTDEEFTAGWHRAYQALYNRYKIHPGFQGYYLMQPAGEWTIQDKPWEGIIAGYEAPTRAAFRHYLRDTLGLSLDALNARWGTKYRAWDDVLPPLPDFQLGKTPDLRMAWVDFNCFKDELGTEWFPTAAQKIREFDKNHVVIAYGGSDSPQKIVGTVDYMHNGGNHFLQREGKLIDAWETGKMGWITEPHHPHRWAAYGDPAQKGWVLDWSIFVMTAQAGGGGANLHVYYMPEPQQSLIAHYGGAFAYDRFQRYLPIMNELQTVKLVQRPTQIAVLQDPYTLFCKHRTTFGARSEDLKRWFELLKQDALHQEDLDPTHLGQYKLVLPNIIDEVMSEQHIVQVDHLVREQGARMLIAANTGKFCPERGAQPFQLLKQLGISPPTGAYVQDQAGVAATVSADNPLFTQGAKVAFFTLADMQRDLQSDEVRKSFWAWPYRWIPQTDYFGFYGENMTTNGRVLARFPSGAVAISQHQVGKGEVIVFWGTPDYKPALLQGMMARAAAWAGVVDPSKGNPIPQMLEGDSAKLGRHYVLLYQETPGAYRQMLANTPDGQWFVDDMVSDQKLGVFTGKELREQGMAITYAEGYSPLKILRMIPVKSIDADWKTKYRMPAQ